MLIDIPTTSYLDFDLTISDIGSISIFISVIGEVHIVNCKTAITNSNRYSDAKLTF